MTWQGDCELSTAGAHVIEGWKVLCTLTSACAFSDEYPPCECYNKEVTVSARGLNVAISLPGSGIRFWGLFDGPADLWGFEGNASMEAGPGGQAGDVGFTIGGLRIELGEATLKKAYLVSGIGLQLLTKKLLPGRSFVDVWEDPFDDDCKCDYSEMLDSGTTFP